MSVGRICTREVYTATRSEPLREAARRMKKEKVGSLVVLDLERKPVGILTDRDVAMACVAGEVGVDARIEKAMSAPITTVHEDTPIESALRTMASAHIRRLVVVDDDGHTVGLLSLDDVLDLLAEEASEIGKLIQAQAPA